MLKEIVAFEWRTHTRQVAFAVAASLFFGFGAMLAATGFGPENVHVNSPYSIAQGLALLSIFSVFVVATFSAAAIVRDREHGMEPIVFTTAIGKLDFLAGRFLGSFAASLTVVALAVPGMIAGALLRGNADGRVGAFDPVAYAWPFATFVVPSMLFAAAVIFAVAALTRSTLASHAAAVFVYVLYFVAAALTNSPLMAASTASGTRSGAAAALADPFGLSAFFEITRYWSPAMRDARLIPLSGALLVNRILAVAIAAALLAVVYRAFAFRVLGRSRIVAAEAPGAAAPHSRYRPVRTERPRALAALMRIELRSLFTSVPFLLVLLMWMALAATEVLSALRGEQGSILMASTSIVLAALAQPLLLVALITLIYFGAEIAWRERSSGMADVVNVTPASNASLALAKFLALSAATGALIAGGFAVALATQLARGAVPDPRLYLWFSWIHGLPLVLFGALVVFVHAASRRKYAGMFVVMLAAVVLAAGGAMRIPHSLLRFGAAPAVDWSDMNGFAPHVLSFHAYMLHWSLVAALLLTLAAGLWRSGSLAALIRRSSLTVRWTGALLALAASVTAALILWQTTVVNTRTTPEERERWMAQYEREYRRYAAIAQPRIERFEGEVALFPREERARVQGRYLLVNRSREPVRRILVGVPREARDVRLRMQGARLAPADERFAHHWFDLARPLPPGARVALAFDLTIERRGFEDEPPDYSIVANGSYLTRRAALPTIGYRRGWELADPGARAKHGLPPRTIVSAAESGEVSDDWIDLDVTIATDAGQTAVTSGRLVASRTAGGRRSFRYRSDVPIPNAVDFVSARYAVVRGSHRGIPVEVYHHPDHGPNAARMIRAATESLAVFERAFGPYRYAQLRMVEIPSYWPFGGFASPGIIALPENRSFLTDATDPSKLDLIYRRIAHETAHQWWGHGVSPANVPGGAAIVETLTKYAEILALESAYGPESARQNLEFELDRYLRGRADQRGAEPPVSLVRNEAHIFYGKGAVVMSGLRDLLGEARLNRALSSFAASESGPGHATTTRDLRAALFAVATAEERGLIASWLDHVVLYDLAITAATARRTADGAWEVALTVRAGRNEVMPDGREAALPLREAVVVSLAGANGEIRRVRALLVPGENAIRVVVGAPPLSAVVDPDVTRVDANRADNAMRVQ